MSLLCFQLEDFQGWWLIYISILHHEKDLYFVIGITSLPLFVHCQPRRRQTLFPGCSWPFKIPGTGGWMCSVGTGSAPPHLWGQSRLFSPTEALPTLLVNVTGHRSPTPSLCQRQQTVFWGLFVFLVSSFFVCLFAFGDFSYFLVGLGLHLKRPLFLFLS